ncbi:deformed epidermal autoregulatory factor 1 homolog isoform X3 [Etheostoma spectabile]|uniref:deformed epidermal autoregulatory factor 1 homolog isoform X3 n=1 Tax=Etheostoma spectabile TaxID=54343 RepID=UPI0013AF759F|nr:deformed epidermal autoregulatory factor 1 homolog isoform X3 [Etheostoma spectabile]
MERRISTRNRNTPKYKDYDEEDEEEQEEEEEYPEDDEQPGTSTQNTPNKRAQDDRLLPVSCGKRNGTLHVKKLYRGEECIESEGRWFSPGAFEDFGGKAASKKWKTSISYKKKPLQFLFEQGLLNTRGFKKRRAETMKQKKIPSRNCISESQSEERETNVTLSTSAKNELQKEVKVVLKRLSELQTTRDCHPSGTEHPLEDSWCTPLDGDADSEEEREHSGSAKDDPIDPSRISDPPIVWGQSNERKDGHRETKTGTPLCAPVASAPDIQPEILNKPDDAGSTCNHTAELRISPVLLVPHGAINIRDVATNTEPIQRDATSSGHDAALLKVIKTEKRFPQASDSTQPSDTVEAPISTQSDLDTMDLDQLKREKIIMQLKVLKLQDEYYTLKIKELKK